MPNPGLSRERVEQIIATYIANRGPERSMQAMSTICGYAEQGSLKRVLEKWTQFYGIGVPPRVYESMTNMERMAVERDIRDGAKPLYETPPFVVAKLPDDDLPIKDVVEQRKREFLQKKKHEDARRLIPVTVKLEGPIGLLHFGDPHVDDDGTDIVTLERHMALTKKVEGVFGCNVGDTTNNWVGRMARLYAEQNVGRNRAIKLAEWFVSNTFWLYMIAGNHDLWSGHDDPIKWIARQIDALYQASEVRVSLNFPNGSHIRVNARHDFAGSSQWNPAHGPGKALQMGVRDHIAIAGHRHESAYNVLKDPDAGITMHAIKVASYKVYDRYARDKGFRDQSLGPACMTIMDPAKHPTHPDLIKVYWDPEEGADVLTYMRKRASSQAKKIPPKPKARAKR